MNVLILSCSTGQGHNSVAEAIREALALRGIPCQVTDALHFVSDRFARFMSWGHSYMYCHFPKLFTIGYSSAEKHTDMLEDGAAVYRLFAKGAAELREYCVEGQFDVVLCTHVFSALMFTEARKAPEITASCFFVSTDYTCSPGTLESELDGYFISDELLAPEFSEKKLFPVGIPVRQQFYQSIPRQQAKKMLGLKDGNRHILLMCGSMGCGPIEEIVTLLSRNMPANCELSVICGNNHKLKDVLNDAAQKDERIHIHGFIDNIPLFMDSADIYVTKPGGISTTEAMVKGLPMVLVDAVAGCEEYNMRYFTGIGGAVAAKKPEDITALCLALLHDEDRRLEMSEMLRNKRTNAAQVIAEHICQKGAAV